MSGTKRDPQRDYWSECVSCAMTEAGVTYTEEQLEYVAGAVEGCHENYGMAFYSPPAGDHYRSEIDTLRRQLETERAKVWCPTCRGRGRIYSQGPVHSSDSQCWKCHGEGKVSP